MREGSPQRRDFIAGRETSVILATDSDGNVTPRSLLDENYWKLTWTSTLNFVYNCGEDTLEKTPVKEDKTTQPLKSSGKKKKKKKSKGVKMNLGEFHNFV